MVGARSETPGARTTDRAGWVGVAAITAFVMFTWAPQLTSPLPANHVGSVAARYGLHVRNLYDHGIIGSHFGADWAPYRTTPYAHHPPLLNVLDAIIGLLPGEASYQVLLIPFLLASTAVPAAAWLLRELGFGWRPTLLAVGAMVATGYFWLYSRVMVDLGAIMAVAAGIVRLRSGESGRRFTIAVAALTLVATLLSWPGIAFAAALVMWLAIGRRHWSAVQVVVAATVLGTVLSLGFMTGAGGADALLDQAGERASTDSYPTATILRRIGEHARELLSWWYLILLPLTVVVGLIDRRTRTLTGLSSMFAIGWVLVLRNGAFVHDYWAYLILVPGLLGGAALVDVVIRRLDDSNLAAAGRAKPGTVASSLLGCGVLATFLVMAYGPTATEYVDRPTDAGRLMEEIDLPAQQRFAWFVEFDYGRLLAYRLDRPIRGVTDVDLPTLADDELIFVDLQDLPSWYPALTPPEPVDERNGYAFVRADALRAAVSDDPTNY